MKTKQANVAIDEDISRWFASARALRPHQKTSEREMATAAIKWAAAKLSAAELAALLTDKKNLAEQLAAAKAELEILRAKLAEKAP